MNTTDRDVLRQMLLEADIPFTEIVADGKPETIVAGKGRHILFQFHPDNSLARIL